MCVVVCCCVLCVQVCVRWHAAGRYQISNTALNSAGPALICNGGCAGVSGHLRFFILTARWPQQEVPLRLDENAPPAAATLPRSLDGCRHVAGDDLVEAPVVADGVHPVTDRARHLVNLAGLQRCELLSAVSASPTACSPPSSYNDAAQLSKCTLHAASALIN